MVSVQPVIFLFGPSGVGKSCASKGLVEVYSFLHLDIDKRYGFQRNGFPAEWDEDISKIDFASLLSDVQSRLAAEQHGAVLSIPTRHVFGSEHLKAASCAGVSTIVLWGKEERCLEARRVRQMARIGWFDEQDYRRKNRRTFETYALAEYSEFRVEAFPPDGSRWPREFILKRILARANPPTVD